MLESRVYKTVMSETHPEYQALRLLCFESKNLYNYANYILRQNFIKEKDLSLHNFYKLRDHIRNIDDTNNPWSSCGTTHIAAGTVQSVVGAWQSFFASLKSFNRHPEKFKKCPRIPKYLAKSGEYPLIVDNHDAKIKDGFIRFPKCFNKYQIPFDKADKVKQVRVIPKYKHLVFEVVYDVEVQDLQLDNGRYASIDLGVDNFATITTNVAGVQSIVLNGKGLKSINQLYNKQKGYYQSIAQQMNGVKVTNRIKALAYKRENQIADMLHKMSRYLVAWCQANSINKVVLGYNPEWKHEVNLGDQTNQNFVQLPYLGFISKVRYKLEAVGIEVIVTEESYTSGTSFLDDELPIKANYTKKRRVTRALFKSNEGQLINADCNGSYQILKKVFPKAYAGGIEDVSLHPVRVNVSSL